MHIIIPLILGALVIFCSHIVIDDHFTDDDGSLGGYYPAYPNKQEWEWKLVSLLPWCVGLLEAALCFWIIDSSYGWLAIALLSILCAAVGFVIVLLSPVPFMLIHEFVGGAIQGVQKLLRQRQLCLEAIRRKELA